MFKKFKFLFLFVFLVSFLIGAPNVSYSDSPVVHFSSGTGSELQPFIINTCSQLQDMNYHDEGGETSYPYLNQGLYFKLGQDIDCSMTSSWNETGEGTGEYYGFMPIGGTYDTAEGQGYGANFIGHFDGNNKTISNLYINRPDFDGVGLFGYVNEINIQNLTLTDLNISGQDQTGGAIGSVTSSSLLNISTSGQVTGEENVGGLVGRTNDTHIENSSSSSEVTGEDNVGGLVGQNNAELPQTILNSFSSSNVTGINNVGGLVGENNGDTITSSYATGNVSLSPDYLPMALEGLESLEDTEVLIMNAPRGFGGLVGYSENGYIVDSYATGSVLGLSNAGGLIGEVNIIEENEPLTIEDSYATGNVLGLATSGGLVGYNNYGEIINSYAIGDVSFDQEFMNQILEGVGPELALEIEELYNNEFVTFGGLIGMNMGGHIENSYAEGNVEGLLAGGLVGTSIGDELPFTIIDSHATGTVTASMVGGGLVGVNMGDTIENSYATGNVIGSYEMPMPMSEFLGYGGLVGFNMGGHIENTYAEGNVEGLLAGGLVGTSIGDELPFTIIDSHATGTVTASMVGGGLVGVNMGDTIEDSYATGNVIGSYEMPMFEGFGFGGLVGMNMLGHIENTYAEGNVEGLISGGLVGFNSGEFLMRTIINSYSSGNVEGSLSGGLIGMNMVDHIYNSYSVGQVTGIGSDTFEIMKEGILGILEEVESIAGGFIGAIMILEGETIEDWIFNSGWNQSGDNSGLSSIGLAQYEVSEEDPINELNVSSSQITEITTLSSLYTKDHPIYNGETQWEWNGNPWYESNTYPLFEETTIRRPSSIVSSGSYSSRRTTPVVTPVPTEEQPGCLPGHIFNPLTGQRCQTLEVDRPNDCQPGFLFSPSTGRSCLTTSSENNQEQLQNTIQRTLRQGMSGEDVVFLQTYLNSIGYDSGIPDGKFGSKTKQAVISFQLANNLIPDGVVGPKTREMMK
ncbi:MAG: peptidoglycan-binding domain-containing protein [Candidatus Pacebacteria bacterium]|nr:peptidoglycan-binding domain-containing protein [Candidatus Paceibacterota bacterium]